ASSLYLIEGRGRALVPVAANTQFQVVGVDEGTGLESFRKLYDPLAQGDPLAAIALPSPVENQIGPYPVFTSPARIETLDLPADGVDLTSVRNVDVKLDNGSVMLRPSSTPLPAGSRVEVLNVMTGDLQVSSDFTGSASIRMRASIGDRLLIIIAETDVDATEPVSIVFNKPIYINGDADAYLHSARLISLLSRDAGANTSFADVTNQVTFATDSGNRRITIQTANPLQLGKDYRLVVSRNIGDTAGEGGTPDLRLGQRRVNGTVGPQLSDDLHIDFSTRTPGGRIASFNLAQGSVRDLALNGNIALVAALDGGLQAFDISDPAALSDPETSRPIATVPAAATEFWAVASDRHGRIYTTGLTSTFGVLRTYRLSDFISASQGTVTRQVGAATVSWRPGINANIPIGTEIVLSDRPEATPRKLQIVLQDSGDDFAYGRDALVSAFSGNAADIGGGFQRLAIRIPGDRSSPYQTQRVTVENRTLDLRWSVDVARNDSATIDNIVARAEDQIYVIRNLRTYGVVTLFGYGVSVFDLNAVESNDFHPAEQNYVALQEQIATSNGSDPTAPTVACDPAESAATGTACPIRDLTFSPEALMQGSDALTVFALDANRGILDLNLVPPATLKPAGGGLTLATSAIDQPRLHTLRNLYRDASGGRQPFAHFTSIAAYKNYALVASNQFGLLVVDLSSGALGWDSLVDVVWIPAGAYSVRVMPDDDTAVVVDGAGRVLLVDLKSIDESQQVAPLPQCRDANCTAELFPIPKKALQSPAAPPPDADWTEVGADDPRIIWKSAPHLVNGTLPPLIDPATGFLFAGDVGTPAMSVIAAADPKLRVVINDGTTFGETTGLVPLGIAPPENVLTGPDGSLAAFRIETTLPAGIVPPRFAIDNELAPDELAPDSPPALPPSHLRGSRAVMLSRALPASVLAQFPALRLQRGATRYVSPWMIALADPRASKQYIWPAGADKTTAGCYSCERPQFLQNDSTVVELYANGRSIVIHPDAATFTGAYDYLNKSHRLTARLASYPADTVRSTNVLSAAQQPPLAAGALQSSVLLHSGELVEQSTDLDAGGRAGWDVVFDRTYRSRTLGGTALGLGWDSSIFRRLRGLPSGNVEYRDGSGEEWLFLKIADGSYAAPAGLFLKLTKQDAGWVMLDQKQRITTFDSYGRLLSESDTFFDGTGGGNIIHYIYDSNGRLSSIVDPVGRVSTLFYASDGSLKTITDWRNRTIDYHVNAQGQLEAVDLPRTKNTQYFEFDHSSDSTRPTVTYKYIQPSSSDYSATLELATNLKSVQEPGDTTPRVTFDYYDSGSQRDMLQDEKWGTFDNAEASFSYTIASPADSATEAVVVDALRQRRTYSLSNTTRNDFSDRVHTQSMVENAVPVWSEAAFGALPAAVLPSSFSTTDVDRTFIFGYDTQGELKTIDKSTTAGAVSTTTYGYLAAGTVGNVLQSKTIASPVNGMAGLAQTFDHELGFLEAVTSDGDRVDTPEAHRGALNPQVSDGGATSETDYRIDGLVSEWHTLPPAAPASGTGEKSSAGYFDANDAEQHRRAMPNRIAAGDDLVTTIAYPDADTEVRDAPRGVETRIEYDELRRPIHITVTGPGAIAPEESFAYDARGRVVRHRRRQGDKRPEERFEYDVVGRLTRSSLYDGETEVETTQDSYALPDRLVTTTLPAGGLIFTNLDGLGRSMDRSTDPKHPFATITVERRRYDADDNVVFTTDGRDATATRYDAAHRAVETLRSDLSRVDTKIDGWGRLRESK
ncbi:MAG TPA: DUF6531 domain-containing protein, partial [Thermoanaerobaculia bacterium]|nr:DUF6531 domain-containing protein [Thermoanaerobaculia bacterium]